MPHAARAIRHVLLTRHLAPGPRAVSGDEQGLRVQIQVFGEPAQRRDAPGSMEDVLGPELLVGPDVPTQQVPSPRVGASSPAIGMVLAFQFSERRGLCAAGTSERVAAHFARAGLPTRIADAPGSPRPTVAQLVELMGQDKKVQRGHPILILVRGIGQAFVSRDQSWAEIGDFLNDHCG